jgi:4-hydroxythreonine-4-phosphate dehydrogenase
MQPTIAISLGDMYGIGPEVILKAFSRSDLFTLCRPIVYGPLSVMEWYRQKVGMLVEVRPIATPAEAADHVISVIDIPGAFDAGRIGEVNADGGAVSIAAIERAFAAVRAGEADALVTAPISKEAIALAGSTFRGHTDMLAAMCDATRDVIMILASNTMKIGLVTVHEPHRAVSALITRERILLTLRSADHALDRDFGIPDGRIAVLAVNPHAGDGGFIGDEEVRVIRPAIEEAQREGIRVEGPFPADGFFSAHNKQLYDMIIAMYHDQGLIPFKMQARGRGVNVSCGLPIVRTSPDHGTAHDIAGRGMASAESMKEAIALAQAIVVNRARRAPKPHD